MVFADKTANVYEISKEEYAKLINDVSKKYQKTTPSTKKKIDKETKHFAKKTKNQKIKWNSTLINQHILH